MKTAKEIAKWAYDGGRNNRLYTYDESIEKIEQKIEEYAESKVKNLALSGVGSTFSFDKIDITENKQQEFIEKWLAEQSKINKR